MTTSNLDVFHDAVDASPHTYHEVGDYLLGALAAITAPEVWAECVKTAMTCADEWARLRTMRVGS